MRYEYRAAPSSTTDREAEPLRIHDDSQEGLYLLLGDFLREHGLSYPQGTPVVRFAISNAGQRTLYIDSVHLTLRTAGGLRSVERLVFDPSEERLIPADLAKNTANILSKRMTQRRPLELVPGDAIGYRFELVRLANILKAAGHSGKVRMTLEVSDRLGKVHQQPFNIDTDLWAYSGEQDGSGT